MGQSRSNGNVVAGRAAAAKAGRREQWPDLRGRRAFHEFMAVRETPAEPGRVYRKMPYGPLLDVFMLDMRSYRGPDGAHDRIYRPDDSLLGPAQVAWLKRELAHSRATWKVIAADSPLGYVVNSAGIDH